VFTPAKPFTMNSWRSRSIAFGLFTPVKETPMLYYAAVFFVIALVAALFGFGGIAVGAAEIAKILFFVFLIITVITLVMGLFRRGKP
jgi:uncharacterized membrane protein YtjA (UPF0391 family)